jgi:hypothetical protein
LCRGRAIGAATALRSSLGTDRASARVLVEALRQQTGEVAGDPLAEFVGVLERQVRGGVIGPDARDELLEASLTVLALLDVDELRHPWRREVVFVLEPRDSARRERPTVAVGVDAHEHVALRR